MSRLVDCARPRGCKSNDFAALALMPFVKSAAIFGNDFLKHSRRNNEVGLNRVRRFNRDVFFADLDIRRNAAKILWSSHSSTPPLLETTERFGSEHWGKPLVHRVNALTGILFVERLGVRP